MIAAGALPHLTVAAVNFKEGSRLAALGAARAG
jgi:hypothetical protein